jgi:hypothetical protein
LEQTANDGRTGAFNDLGHTPFGAPTAVCANQQHFDAIAVQDSAHLIGRQVNIWGAVIAGHKTVSITVSGDGSRKFVQGVVFFLHK